MGTKLKNSLGLKLILLIAVALIGGFAYVSMQEFPVSTQAIEKELPHALLLPASK